MKPKGKPLWEVFADASETFKKLNPDLFVGRLRPQKPEQNTGVRAKGKNQGEKGGAVGVEQDRECGQSYRVTLVSVRRRLITDSDNCATGYKHLRDSIAAWLGTDDADKFIDWQYRQLQTKGKQGTIVLIERL